MIKQIGTKIYYCNIAGNVIKIIGDMQGYVKETNFDEDYEIYTELKERDKETIGLIQFEFGEYSKLSKGSTGISVNLETKELIFTYEPTPEPPKEPTWRDKIEEKISILEAENANLREGLQAVLSGDMQGLAYILYPEDFADANKSNTTLEL